MTALYIILAIVAFFVLLLSVRFVVTVHYEDDVFLSLSWLFLKFDLLPMKEKHKKTKKEKKKKKEKKPEKDETVSPPKEKKDNMFVRFYKNQGGSGVIRLINDAAGTLGGMFKRIGRAFVFNEIFVSLTVSDGDSAKTAEKYGKTCGAIYPAMGLIVSTARVKKYGVEVTPDFIYGKNNARFHVKTSVRPISLITAIVIFAFEFLFKVVIKLLKHGKAQKADEEKQIINNSK